MSRVISTVGLLLVTQVASVNALPTLHSRFGSPSDFRCGLENANSSCDPALCCSASGMFCYSYYQIHSHAGTGYCGTGAEYCQAPGCQIAFSTACDAQKTPAGPSTVTIPRNQLSTLPFGWAYSCTQPNTVALTFDDGPSDYTSHILDLLDDNEAKATFFIIGSQRGRQIDDTNTEIPALILRMLYEGHQIGSHTWGHDNLNEDSTEQRQEQMIKNEMAIRNIIGQVPTYMRPPFTACDAECEADVAVKLGYYLVGWDLDTEDYKYATPENSNVAQQRFTEGLNKANGKPMLVVGHDRLEETS